MRRYFGATRLSAYVLLGFLAAFIQGPTEAQDTVSKRVHLVEEDGRLVASNTQFSRFDELKLAPRERVREAEEGDAVLIVVTNQRILGYGAISGWREIDRLANETVESLSAEDYAGLVITNQRLLNFNGQSGVWAEYDRPVGR